MNFTRIFKDEWTRIFRHKELRSLILVSPLLYGIMLPSVYWHQRLIDRPVGVVDLDHSQLSRELTRQLDASDGIAIRDAYSDIEEGREALRSHEVDAVLTIPKYFHKAFKKRKGAVAAIGVSSSNLAVAGPILGSAATVAAGLSAKTFAGTVMARNIHRSRAQVLAQPLAADIRPIYNPELNQSDAMIPGLLFVVLQQIIIMGLCLIMAEEREFGQTQKADPTVKARGAFIWGKTLPYALINLIFSGFFFCCLLPLFKVPVHLEKLPAFLVLSAAFAIAVSLAGFVIGHAFKDRLTVMIVLMFYSLPGFIASGYSWPEFALTWDIRLFSYLFPITHFAEEVRRVILGPIGGMSYLHSFGALALYSLLFYLVAAWTLRVKSRPDKRVLAE